MFYIKTYLFKQFQRNFFLLILRHYYLTFCHAYNKRKFFETSFDLKNQIFQTTTVKHRKIMLNISDKIKHFEVFFSRFQYFLKENSTNLCGQYECMSIGILNGIF